MHTYQCSPQFDATVYKQRLIEQRTLITLSISVNCESVASVHLTLHAKQIRSTFQLLQDIRHFHPQMEAAALPETLVLIYQSKTICIHLHDTRVSYPDDEGISIIRNVGIHQIIGRHIPEHDSLNAH